MKSQEQTMSPEWKFLLDTVVRWLPYLFVLIIIPVAILLIRYFFKGACRNGPICHSNSHAEEKFWMTEEDRERKRLHAKNQKSVSKHQSLPEMYESGDIFKTVNLFDTPPEGSCSKNNQSAPINVVGGDIERGICSLCTRLYTEDDVARNLPCSHHFHHECAEGWFSKRGYCPQCIRPSSVSILKG